MLYWLIIPLFIGSSLAEVYTSMSDMSHLLNTEYEILRTFENYIQSQEKRLNKLRSDLSEMGRLHSLAAKSPDDFLANPINAYLLVKRLTVDWADMQSSLTEDQVGQAMLNNLTSMAEYLRWPDEEDLSGVATAVMRLQDTYKLETAQLASGSIVGKQQSYRELTAGDCFELGRQAYNTGDHLHTMQWMKEALSRLEKEDEKTIPRADILEYLAFSTYTQGHVRQALKLTTELLELRPNHKRAQGNKVYYEDVLRNGDDPNLEVKIHLTDEDELKAINKGYTVSENIEYMTDYQRERFNYERLCRGEGKMTDDAIATLTCFYQYGPGHMLRISPIKAEVAHLHPTITIYHNVLYDSEIAKIKELATPRFKRATVQNYKTGELETASYRISKSAWLRSEESEQIFSVNKRIELITGLDLDTAEELQVANYGIGGHYEPHFDYARREEKDAFKSLGTGNRIATFLFYMSDVEAGGATVFPHLELSLWPRKGAAAFWHNLHPSGEGDELTRHAACPVLVGTKWVSNKWIHERGQERRRPCGQHIDDLVKRPEQYSY